MEKIKPKSVTVIDFFDICYRLENNKIIDTKGREQWWRWFHKQNNIHNDSFYKSWELFDFEHYLLEKEKADYALAIEFVRKFKEHVEFCDMIEISW